MNRNCNDHSGHSGSRPLRQGLRQASGTGADEARQPLQDLLPRCLGKEVGVAGGARDVTFAVEFSDGTGRCARRG